jgi:hypothetical protein
MKMSVVLIATLFVSLAFAHEGHHHGPHTSMAKSADAPPELKQIYEQIDREYSESVRPIFENKCAACHSSLANAPWYASLPIVNWVVESDRSEAKVHLEISKGFPFQGHGTPDEDLDAIKEVAQKGTMPPTLYRWLHPKSDLNASDKEAVMKWIDSAKGQLKH